MESLRTEFIGYIKEFLPENEAIEFEENTWKQFNNSGTFAEELYKIKMKSYLTGLQDSTIDMGLMATPHTVHDINKKRWKMFDDLVEHQRDVKQRSVATTDLFLCNRCKERKCIYHTAQTRSADESATIFIECINCGLRWKQ